MGRLAKMLAEYESEQFGEEAEKEISPEAEKECEEYLREFIILAGDKILEMIDEIKADPIEKELNKETFRKELSGCQDLIDAFQYLVYYIETMWMVQDKKQDKKLGRKNKKIIRRLAKNFEKSIGGKWFSFC